MVKNQLKVFLRTIRNHPGYFISNVTGLAVGMATCILILLYVRYEFSWNTSYENHERIYRVQQAVQYKDGVDYWSQTGYALAEEIEKKIPEVEEAVVLHEIWGEYLSASDELTFYENSGYYAHPDIFRVFAFDFLQGDPETALSEPFSIVLTREYAEKYFPGENPVGQTLKASQNELLQVTGVIATLPRNVDFRPDYLVSFPTYKQIADWKEYDEMEHLGAAMFRNYLLLKPGHTRKAVDGKISNFLDEYLPENYKKLYLKPLTDIHLVPEERADLKIALYFMAGIAIFVLILACINFINLSTANSSLRKREIGIRKVVGASKSSLFQQFIGESMLYTLCAIVLAFVLAELTLPLFSTVVQRPLTINYFTDFGFVLMLACVFIVTGLLAGVYPAVYLSAFRPASVLKGNLLFFGRSRKRFSRNYSRKFLVGFQFVISVTLILTTLFVVKQVDYMHAKDLGFTKEHLLLCKVYGERAEGSFETLRTELIRHPDILDASVSITAPFNGNQGREITWQGASPEEKINIRYNPVGYNFISTYQFQMKLGRNFSREYSTDKNACIINETAWRQFRWDDPLGKAVILHGNRYKVVGVVEDFHPFTVHQEIPPYLMLLHPGTLAESGMYAVRTAPDATESTRKFVRQQFRHFFPNAILEVAPFAQNMDYGTRDVWAIVENVFFMFSIIAILLAANGLFGLVSFAAQRRFKEIGIRKVLGAKTPGLYTMMLKDFLIILAFALAAALPTAYILQFTTPGAYKYEMQFMDYFLGVGLMVLTVLVATAYHTTKAVMADPVESLRYE